MIDHCLSCIVLSAWSFISIFFLFFQQHLLLNLCPKFNWFFTLIVLLQLSSKTVSTVLFCCTKLPTEIKLTLPGDLLAQVQNNVILKPLAQFLNSFTHIFLQRSIQFALKFALPNKMTDIAKITNESFNNTSS